VMGCSFSFLMGSGKSQTDIPMARTRARIVKYLSVDFKVEFKVLLS
jgi:hypothetical protein